ncbi:MAG: glycosyltransferase family 9 protein [Planctomycetota bacterium]|nr:glycosyltransferase family 9 protein [Planctomycetota bacterium]
MKLGFAKFLDRVGGRLLGHVVGGLDAMGEAFGAPRPVTDVTHVLVLKFWGLGNWALLRPIVRDLRAAHPRAKFTIATLASNRPLVEDLADELLLVDPSRGFTIAADLARAVRRLRTTRPQLAIDFEQFARTGALLARMGGVPQRLGFRSRQPGRDGLYTVTVPFRRDVHVTRSFRDLAEAAGVPAGAYRPGGLTAEPAAIERVVRAHDLGARVVVLHPGSGDNFPGRRWSAAGFAAVGRAAVEAGRRVAVTGGAAEAELTARVARAVGSGAVDLAGRLDLDELVALLAHAEVLASNDTGPVHLASQLGTPVLAFFGPNTPVLYGPLSPGSRAFYRDLPCSPCLTNANYRSSRCRIHTCMLTIPTGEAVEALRGLLRGADVPLSGSRA